MHVCPPLSLLLVIRDVIWTHTLVKQVTTLNKSAVPWVLSVRVALKTKVNHKK